MKKIETYNPRSLSARRVIVIDDEPSVCSMVADFLSDLEGISVLTFSDPHEAVQKIQSESVDIVITDLVIGSTSGVDILDTTLESHPDALVILMTAYPTVKTAISVLQRGGYDYLVKPFKLERMRNVVVRALETQNVRRENLRLKEELGLLKVSASLLSDNSLSETLDRVVEAAMYDLDAAGVSLELTEEVDSEKEYSRIRTGSPGNKELEKILREEMPSLSSETGLSSNAQDNLGIDRSIICQPLHSGNQFFGWLRVLFDRKSHNADQRFLEILGAGASAAIARSQLSLRLSDSYLQVISALAGAIEARDWYTAGHTDRVSKMAEVVASNLGWSDQKMIELRHGSTLHDIGKIGVPDSILNKPGRLTEYERKIMMKHPEMGVKIIEGIDFLKGAIPYLLYHHERYDGAGYPMGLAGEDIPIEGRILAVADTVDAILSDRPYRKGASPEQAISELIKHKGTQFDPKIVDIFLKEYQSGAIDIEKLYEDNESKTGGFNAIFKEFDS